MHKPGGQHQLYRAYAVCIMSEHYEIDQWGGRAHRATGGRPNDDGTIIDQWVVIDDVIATTTKCKVEKCKFWTFGQLCWSWCLLAHRPTVSKTDIRPPTTGKYSGVGRYTTSLKCAYIIRFYTLYLTGQAVSKMSTSGGKVVTFI